MVKEGFVIVNAEGEPLGVANDFGDPVGFYELREDALRHCAHEITQTAPGYYAVRAATLTISPPPEVLVPVVSHETDGAGGFWWFPTEEDADQGFFKEVKAWKDSRPEDGVWGVYRYAVPVPQPLWDKRETEEGKDAITEHIDAIFGKYEHEALVKAIAPYWKNWPEKEG